MPSPPAQDGAGRTAPPPHRVEPLDGLPLLAPTPPGWVAVACGDLDRLLADHAHCEQKAACAALALVGRFPQHVTLFSPLLALAQEEVRHRRDVLARIEARGGAYGRPEPDGYVRAVRALCCEDSDGLGAPGDLLLAAALVEARSCERFRLLAGALSPRPGGDGELGAFYARLAVAEARHWELFRDLAGSLYPASRVRKRLSAVARREAELILQRPLLPRMH
ncbi:MAG: tRNA isopentenyl-2-thiomethyl-A-37 hydroxylase MiaE [Acidobacteriota bacterium]